MNRGAVARAVAAVVGLWLAAAGIEYAVPVWSRALAPLGDAMPMPTALAMAALRLHLPYAGAAIGTLAIGLLLGRGSPRLGDSCLALLFLAATAAALTAWALALPLDACGFCAVIGDAGQPGPLALSRTAI